MSSVTRVTLIGQFIRLVPRNGVLQCPEDEVGSSFQRTGQKRFATLANVYSTSCTCPFKVSTLNPGHEKTQIGTEDDIPSPPRGISSSRIGSPAETLSDVGQSTRGEVERPIEKVKLTSIRASPVRRQYYSRGQPTRITRRAG
jgi:hypothetical protein